MYFPPILAKWNAQLGEEYSTNIKNENLSYCPSCKENIDELIGEILLDGKSTLQADCV